VSDSAIGYKVLTHDLRPPLQGGKPLYDGTLPHELPRRKLDTSDRDCAPGWHYTRRPETALRIAGLWPTGRPSVLLRVEPIGEWVERGDKCRAESLRLLAVCSERTVRAAVRRLSEPFGAHADQMARDQMAWRCALARPGWDEAKVEAGLRAALDVRGLDAWVLRRFEAEGAVWAVWAAWDASLDARDAWAARAAWAAARGAWDAQAAARAAWAARDAWAAWAARDALTVEFAALAGWIDADPYLLTTGLRDAYAAGLAIAMPTGPNELGWAMEERAG